MDSPYTSDVARTFFLLAYSNAAEEEDSELERASAGQDWNDIAPETPPEAIAFAAKFLDRFQKALGTVTVEQVCEAWIALTGLDADRFAHCLAMEANGQGVGLGDDFNSNDEKLHPTEAALLALAREQIPNVEVSFYDLFSGH